MKKIVTIRYFAALRECAGIASEERETQANSYAELYDELNTAYQFPLPCERVRVAVGEAYADMNQPIHDKAEIAFIPPVAGG